MLGRELHPRNHGPAPVGARLQGNARRGLVRGLASAPARGCLCGSTIRTTFGTIDVSNVTSWHYEVITGLGFELAEIIRPEVKGFKYGENRDNPGKQPFRLPEKVLVFVKPQVSD